MTTKKLHVTSIIHELLWFLQGETNTAYLKQNGVTIWDEWADANGELGPIYGYQWRFWPAADGRHIDQIKRVMEQLRKNPDSRRIIVSAWNVADLDKMALQPCHAMFQLWVADGKLSCQMYQRSADIFLGVPFNIASYALLTHMFAQQAGFEPGELIWTGGDCHLYLNHLEQAELQLAREPHPLPNAEQSSASHHRFSITSSKTSKSAGTRAIPHIKARCRSERSDRARLHCGGHGPQSRDRQGRWAPVASAGRPQGVQGRDAGQARSHGPAHVDTQSAKPCPDGSISWSAAIPTSVRQAQRFAGALMTPLRPPG